MENNPKYIKWRDSVIKEEIVQIRPLKATTNESLFVLIDVTYKDHSSKNYITRTVVLRGDAVACALFIKEKGTENYYVPLVKQFRLPVGKYVYEVPAGMMNSETDPYQTMKRELIEETGGFNIKEDELILLNNKPLYSSPGMLDEGMYYFGAVLELDKESIEKLQDTKHGLEEENEDITLNILPLEEAMSVVDSSIAMLNILLMKDRLRL